MKLNLPLKYFISKLCLPHHSFEACVILILQNKTGILGVLQGSKGDKVRHQTIKALGLFFPNSSSRGGDEASEILNYHPDS